MEASEVIAAFALVVSLVSAWVSYRAYSYAVRTKEEETRIQFSREKSEFLVRIDKARKSFDRLEYRLKDLLEKFDGRSEDVRRSLASEATLLRADLEYLEGCQRQVWSLWDETYEMNQSGLAHHKPQFLAIIEDDERFVVEAQFRCERTNEKISRSGV